MTLAWHQRTGLRLRPSSWGYGDSAGLHPWSETAAPGVDSNRTLSRVDLSLLGLGDAMFKGIVYAILGACAAFFITCSTTPAAACDVQIGRPNSCSQWCDGDFINGPEIISCPEYIRQKRATATQAEKARQDRIRQEEIRREKQLAAQEAERARIREAERENERQKALAGQKTRDGERAAEEDRNRKRQAEIEFARQELELKKQQFELAEKERERQEAAAKARAERKSEEAKGGKVVNTPLSIALILSMVALGFATKKGNPLVKFVSVIAVPVSTYAMKYFFGIEIEDKLTLAEIPLFAPAFGGLVVATLMYRVA